MTPTTNRRRPPQPRPRLVDRPPALRGPRRAPTQRRRPLLRRAPRRRRPRAHGTRHLRGRPLIRRVALPRPSGARAEPHPQPRRRPDHGRPSTSEAVRTLTDRDSQAVYVDGAGVVSDWLARGLIDDPVLTRAPVVLSDGIALFGPVRDDLRFVHLGTSWNEHGLPHDPLPGRPPRTSDAAPPRRLRSPTPTPSDG